MNVYIAIGLVSWGLANCFLAWTFGRNYGRTEEWERNIIEKHKVRKG